MDIDKWENQVRERARKGLPLSGRPDGVATREKIEAIAEKLAENDTGTEESWMRSEEIARVVARRLSSELDGTGWRMVASFHPQKIELRVGKPAKAQCLMFFALWLSWSAAFSLLLKFLAEDYLSWFALVPGAAFGAVAAVFSMAVLESLGKGD